MHYKLQCSRALHSPHFLTFHLKVSAMKSLVSTSVEMVIFLCKDNLKGFVWSLYILISYILSSWVSGFEFIHFRYSSLESLHTLPLLSIVIESKISSSKCLANDKSKEMICSWILHIGDWQFIEKMMWCRDLRYDLHVLSESWLKICKLKPGSNYLQTTKLQITYLKL